MWAEGPFQASRSVENSTVWSGVGSFRRVRLGIAVALLAAAVPVPVRAWTDARVRSVSAHVEVRNDGSARVAMELLVRIHGGWLEGLEVAGLDPDFALDEAKPPWAVSDDDPALKFEPTVRVPGSGRVALGFRGRGRSPRRGTVRIGIVYTTSLAHRATAGRPDGTIRVRWTLPPWRSGLDGVTIAFTLPPGAEAAQSEGDQPHGPVEPERLDLEDRTVLVWQRIHLPRTMAWTVEADVPAEHMATELRAPARPARPEVQPLVDPRRPSHIAPAVLAGLLALLVLLGRATFDRACRAANARPRRLLPLPAPLHAAAALASSASAAWVWPDRPTTGLGLLAFVALLSIQRAPQLLAHTPRLGRWRPAGRAEVARGRRASRIRWVGLATPVDVTAPLGLLLVGACAGAALLVARWEGRTDGRLLLAGAALLLVPALTGTRFHLPTTPELRLHRLARLARRSRLEGAALALVVHADPAGRWQDARLRLAPGRAPDGLLRLDLAIADSIDLGGARPRLVLVAVARTASAAAAALARALPGVRATRVADRTARVLPVERYPWPAVHRTLSALQASDVTPRPVDSEAA